MRELTTDDLGVLLGLFAILLVAFAIDFRFSVRAARRHRRSVLLFGTVALIGEMATALALVLSWVALWSPTAWERIDNMLVFVPGSISIACAVFLTVDKIVGRLEHLRGTARRDSTTEE